MYRRELQRDGHTRRFLIIPVKGQGWEVREEQDREILSRRQLNDWHRVEGRRLMFATEVAQLRAAGWTEVSN